MQSFDKYHSSCRIYDHHLELIQVSRGHEDCIRDVVHIPELDQVSLQKITMHVMDRPQYNPVVHVAPGNQPPCGTERLMCFGTQSSVRYSGKLIGLQRFIHIKFIVH